jgi:hypothetical protein
MSKRKLFTWNELKQMACYERNKHLFPPEPEKKEKRSKYNNRKTEVDGIEFDSEKEADRYKDLLLMVKAGEIGMLERQKEYELNPGGTYSYKYKCDFRYIEMKTGEKVVEDVKGFRTREYKKKKQLMKKVHGITIKEI